MKLRPRDLRKSAILFILDGIASSVSSSLFDPFFIPFLVVIGATNMQIGIITALVYLSKLARVPASLFLGRFSNKRVNLLFSFLYVISTACFFAIPLVVDDWFVPVALSVILMNISVSVRSMAFQPWFASLIPEKYANRYRVKRTTFMLLLSIPLMILGSVFMKDSGSPWAYAALFSVSLLFNAAGIFVKMFVPEKKTREHKGMRASRGMMKFLVFEAIFWFGVGLSGSFISVYFMRDLGKTVFWVVLYVSISRLTRLALYKSGVFGEMADEGMSDVGLVASTLFISLVPLLAIFSFNPLVLLALGIVNGVGWSGYDTFRWDYIVKIDKRRMKQNFALLDSIANMSMMAGSFAGGMISSASYGPVPGIIALFVAGFAIRAAASLYSYFFIRQRGKSVKEAVAEFFPALHKY